MQHTYSKHDLTNNQRSADITTEVCFVRGMQEQAGDSVLPSGGLLQARLRAHGECGGHLQEGGRNICQVRHGVAAGYALPSQGWHHCSLRPWRAPDTQQVSQSCCALLQHPHPLTMQSYSQAEVTTVFGSTTYERSSA